MISFKTFIKAGVGTAAAVLGTGALVYECALNKRVNSFFIKRLDRIEPAEDAPDCEETCTRDPAWMETHKGEDQVISTDVTGRIHAYIIPSERSSHRWVVLCHGYNAAPESTGVYAQHYHKLGFNCICPAMRGWGNDETVYCTMGYHDKKLYDGQAVWRLCCAEGKAGRRGCGSRAGGV